MIIRIICIDLDWQPGGRVGTGVREKLGNSLFDQVAMESPEVVEAGLAALDKNHAVMVPGWKNKAVAASTRFAPRSIVRKIAGAIKY